MPRKLTIVGVLTALVLGVIGLAQTAQAVYPNGIQSFCSVNGEAGGTCPAAQQINWDICYDTTYPTNSASPPQGPGLTGGCQSANLSDVWSPTGSAGVPTKTYQIINVPTGSRLTLPTTYTPSAFGRITPALGAVTGTVSALTDVFCNAPTIDVLSKNTFPASGGTNAWPNNGWAPFDFRAGAVAGGVITSGPDGPPGPTTTDYSYIDKIKPMPFPDVSVGVSRLTKIWLGGSIGFVITPVTPNPDQNGTPLVVLETDSTYVPGLHAQVSILGGDPTPPNNSYICVDSPQNSVAEDDTLVPPTADGEYLRWTAFTSAADIIDGTVTRVLVSRCIKVGGTQGPCTGTLLNDSDGDRVPDGVEAILGTNPAVVDTDSDGATDYDEIFQFTNPLVADTDGDGFMDKQADLAGFNNTAPLFGQTTATDNCPVDANGAAGGENQLNTDSLPDWTNTPNVPAGAIYRGDTTNPHQDHLGDACDPDIDNDGLANVTEAGGFLLATAPPPSGSLWCLPKGSPGSTVTAYTDPKNPDSDSDGGLDGRECQFGSNPVSITNGTAAQNPYWPSGARVAGTQNPSDPGYPSNAAVLTEGSSANSCGATTACVPNGRYPSDPNSANACSPTDPGGLKDCDGDLLFPDQAETFYRTSHINTAGGGVLNDLEQPGSYGATVPDGKIGAADNDSDGDLINDGVEVKFYATSPANFDTDADGCSDGREIGDVNGDRKVNSTDLGAISSHGSGVLKVGGSTSPPPNGAPGNLYLVSGVRRDEEATYDLNKDGKIDSTDLSLDSKLTGNCAAGTLAQTAQAIVRANNP